MSKLKICTIILVVTTNLLMVSCSNNHNGHIKIIAETQDVSQARAV